MLQIFIFFELYTFILKYTQCDLVKNFHCQCFLIEIVAQWPIDVEIVIRNRELIDQKIRDWFQLQIIHQKIHDTRVLDMRQIDAGVFLKHKLQ